MINQRLNEAGIPSSSEASDAEFLRRVTLDIVGRIPTYEETVAFLKNDASDKRQTRIDELLDRSSYADHFASIWCELIVPRNTGKSKSGRDPFVPWLTEQFHRNRAWNEIVDDMLTAEGKLREIPQTGFVLANSENGDPQPNLLTDATARLFWGVQLRCAECHDHPFAPWKQADFWGTAAFFSRVRRGYSEGKNPAGWTVTELPPDEPISQKSRESLPTSDLPGPVIVIPAVAGKRSGTAVKARFLGGADVDWSDDGPFRQRFSKWATGPDHPYFAANAANRMWAHFFGRGFVNPLDALHESELPSHPELQQLATEFVASDFDLKHLIRCVCNTRAYQRSSRPVTGNEADTALFSHAAVRSVRPEVLYDSLSIVLIPHLPKSGQKGPFVVDHAHPIPGVSRDEFVQYFGSVVNENTGRVVNQGIPQFLRLMNGSPLDGKAPVVEHLVRTGVTGAELVDVAYLTALSRQPTVEERQRMTEYVDASSDTKSAATGLLWILLNCSEFALNH